ncbi:MAG: hypothetical protein Q7S00_02065 [bacterium]|nr:hypothetical protein [bacterium]
MFSKSFYVDTNPERNVVNIIHDLNQGIRESKLAQGLLTVVSPATDVALLTGLEGKVKTAKEEVCLWARFLSLPFIQGEVLLGPQQGCYLIDFGKKASRREFSVHIMGGEGTAAAKPAAPTKGMPPRGPAPKGVPLAKIQPKKMAVPAGKK